MTPKDKELSCEELKLEMNDAYYNIVMARKNRGLRWGNVLWPFAYPATLVSANQAIKNSEQRLGYLQKISRIKACDRALYEKL